MALLGSGILAFGLYHVHSLSGVTEGGVLGMTLLLHHWFGISPAVSGFVMNAACYVLGWRLLGKSFIAYSIVAGGGFSVFYAVFERFPAFVAGPCTASAGCGAGGCRFCGRWRWACRASGQRPGGDDALAMSICKLTK